MEPEVENYIQQLQRQADEALVQAGLVASAFSLCESPIERQLLLAYLQIYPCTVVSDVDLRGQRTHLFVDRDIDSRSDWVSFCPQMSIFIRKRRVQFRPDFVFMHMVEDVENARVNCLKNVIVEVDGHDFHERTKEQAQRDKSRDRLLQRQGFSVLRYTGSEIFRDAESVVREIREFIVPAEAAA